MFWLGNNIKVGLLVFIYILVLFFMGFQRGNKILTSLFLLPYNGIINIGPNFVKFDGLLRVKGRIEYIF